METVVDEKPLSSLSESQRRIFLLFHFVEQTWFRLLVASPKKIAPLN